MDRRAHWREERTIERIDGDYNKVCPHCGKSDALDLVQIVEKFPAGDTDRGGVMVYESFAVTCRTCGAWGGAFRTKEHAVFMWNARTIPANLRGKYRDV